jgi:hypothetical protein
MKNLLVLLLFISTALNSQALGYETYTPIELKAMIDNGIYPEQAKAGTKSTSRNLDFGKCIRLISKIFGQVGDYYPTEVIVQSSILRSEKIWTNDGTLLISCSKPDGTMIMTESKYADVLKKPSSSRETNNKQENRIKSTSKLAHYPNKYLKGIFGLYLNEVCDKKTCRNFDEEIFGKKVYRLLPDYDGLMVPKPVKFFKGGEVHVEKSTNKIVYAILAIDKYKLENEFNIYNSYVEDKVLKKFIQSIENAYEIKFLEPINVSLIDKEHNSHYDHCCTFPFKGGQSLEAQFKDGFISIHHECRSFYRVGPGCRLYIAIESNSHREYQKKILQDNKEDKRKKESKLLDSNLFK